MYRGSGHRCWIDCESLGTYGGCLAETRGITWGHVGLIKEHAHRKRWVSVYVLRGFQWQVRLKGSKSWYDMCMNFWSGQPRLCTLLFWVVSLCLLVTCSWHGLYFFALKMQFLKSKGVVKLPVFTFPRSILVQRFSLQEMQKLEYSENNSATMKNRSVIEYTKRTIDRLTL